MWGWDPSKGEGPVGGSTPTLLPSEAASLGPKATPQPIAVHYVQGLKQQFEQQQSELAHIKETLRENDADRTSKEKQLQMYANKLEQIKSRSKISRAKAANQNNPSKSCPQRKSSKENLTSPGKTVQEATYVVDESSSKKLSVEGKVTELKRRLEETKIMYEERTEQGMSDARKIENMVEQLRSQLQERDLTIHELQKAIDTPPALTFPTPPSVLPRRHKEKPLSIAKWTQTQSNEQLNVQPRLKELEAIIVDLQDTVKQQASVIAARTQAVTLLSEDLSKKGKSTVDELEDAKRAMREMQANFIEVESSLKVLLTEKDEKLKEMEEKLLSLEITNAQHLENYLVVEAQLKKSLPEEGNFQKNVELKSAELTELEVVNTQKVHELEKKIAELRKELDDSNKLTIRLKLEHKNKIKAANKALDQIKKSSDDKAEAIRLSSQVDKLESMNSRLEAQVAELEEEKATNLLLKQQVQDKDNIVLVKDLEVESLKDQLAVLEDEKRNMVQTIEEKNIIIDNLNKRIQNFDSDSTSFEPYEIPGDGAAKQFETSNESVQNQIEVLVEEKMELLEKLRNLSGAMFTESSTFEKVESDFEEPFISASATNVTMPVIAADESSDLCNLRNHLDNEKIKTQQYEARINELETLLADSTAITDREIVDLKNRLVQLESELASETHQVDVLKQSLTAKDHLLATQREQINALEKNEDNWKEVTDLREIQQKCLSLESSLLQLTEQCERLRKENIELSGEKIRRVRAEEDAEAVRALQAEAEALESRVRDLETILEHRALEDKDLEYANIVIASKNTDIFNLESALADRTQVIERLKEELQSSLTQADENNARLSQQGEEVTQLRSSLLELRSSWESVNLQLKHLQGVLSDKDNRLAELSDQTVSYERQVSEISAEYARISAELANAVQYRATLEGQLAKTEETLQQVFYEREAHSVREVQAEAAIRVALEDKSKLQERCQELEEVCREIKAVEKDLTVQLDRRSRELAAKQEELDGMTKKAKQLVANLKKKTQVEKDLLDQVSSLSSEKEALLEQLGKGHEMTEKWVMENSEKNDLMRRQEELLVVKQKLTDENNELIAARDILKEEMDTLNKEVQMLRQQLELVNIEKGQLSEMFQSEKVVMETRFDGEKKNMTEALANLTSENADLMAKLSGLERDLTALRQTLECEEEENAALSSQRASMLEENQQLKLTHQESVTQIHALREGNDQLSKEVEQLTQTLNDLMVKEEKFSQMVEEISLLRQLIEEKDRALDTYEERKSDSDKTIHGLQEMVESLQDEKGAIESRISVVENNAKLEAEQYNAQIIQLNTQLNNFNLAFDAEVQKNAAYKYELQLIHNMLQKKDSGIVQFDGYGVCEEKTDQQEKISFSAKTDDDDDIEELKNEIVSLLKALDSSEAAVKELQAALIEKETEVRQEASEQKDSIKISFEERPGDDDDEDITQTLSSEQDPFQWDDSWGAEARLEQEHALAKFTGSHWGPDPSQVSKLEAELKLVSAEKEACLEDLKLLQVKYAKVIKKLKEQKLLIDKLQVERNMMKNNDCASLDAAIIDELRLELSRAEKNEAELRKELEVAKIEKEDLLKKMESLVGSNDKQENDATMWRNKTAELRTQLADLQAQLLIPPPDQAQLVLENRELKNLIEGLEWKVTELTEMVEEKDEEIVRLTGQQQTEDTSEHISKDRLQDVERQLSIVLEEKGTLQELLNEHNRNVQNSNVTIPAPSNAPTDLSQWFPMENQQPFDFQQDLSRLMAPEQGSSADNELLVEEVKYLKEKINSKDQDVEKLTNELAASCLQLKLEKESFNEQLSSKDKELATLRARMDELEKAYEYSKSEVQRLLNEEQLHSDSSLEELMNAKRSFECEAARYESIIKEKDFELTSLRDSLRNIEREIQEPFSTVEQPKIQLCKLDYEDVQDLRELCALREAELSELRNQQIDVTNLRAELSAMQQQLHDKNEQLTQVMVALEERERECNAVHSGELKIVQQCLAAKDFEAQKLAQNFAAVEAELLTRDVEVRELRAEVLSKDAELRDQNTVLRSLHDEVAHFRNFDEQLTALRNENERETSDAYDLEESMDLVAQLKKDLDAALYTLHLRDVRCDELTFELRQLLEERDTLQLRLSTTLRQNVELREKSAPASPASLPVVPEDDQAHLRQLYNKISELHTVGYSRDKNIQEESEQRHREQMALLSRDARSKTKAVFDV